MESETILSTPIRLTAEQQTLVAHPETGGPALAVAVAGAGKTTAICATVQRMIALGVLPTDILVATFSKAGADDMRARAAKVGVAHGVSWRTLHSCGWSIVGEVSGLGKESRSRRDPVIVDPRGPQGWWVKKLLREFLTKRARNVGNPEMKEKIKKASGAVLSEIGVAQAHLIWPEEWTAAPCAVTCDTCQGTGLSPIIVKSHKAGDPVMVFDGHRDPCPQRVFPSYAEWAETREREPADSLTASLAAGFYALWEEVKAEPELRGFEAPKDRHLPRSLHPLTYPSKRKPRRLVKWFSYDDMIAWPARWVLEGKRFTETYRDVFSWVVVDESQDNNLAQTALAEHLAANDNIIFVGDDQQSIYAFRGSRPALLRIFRDRHAIKQIEFTANFRCAQGILDVGNGILAHAPDRLYDGDLRLGRTDALATKATVTATEYFNADAEAEAVIDGIVEAIAHGVSPDEIAVLYRLNSQSGPLELACIKRGLLYRVAGNTFFNRAEIKTAIAFLTCATDERNQDAWLRISRSIVRGLGPSFIRDYSTLADARRAAKKRGLLSGWKKALKTLLPIVDKTKALLRDGGLVEAISYLANDAGIRAYYRDDAANDEDETDVDVALDGLIQCAESIDGVEALLRFANADNGKSATERQPAPCITLSTAHKAKGLEWTYVACPGWTAGVFPFFRSPLDEERRLGYVAATRARQHLHISWTEINGKGEPAGPSVLVENGNVCEVAEACGAVHWPVATDESDEAPAPEWGTAIGG